MPTAGDERHYLITAASVYHDADFDVSNNYGPNAAREEGADPGFAPHAFRRNGGLWPAHMPGLSILIAVPYALAGTPAVRAVLATLLMLTLATAIRRWNARYLPAHQGTATFSLLACSPAVFGASQIYPDLPGGAAILALVVWLWGAEPAPDSDGAGSTSAPGCSAGCT